MGHDLKSMWREWLRGKSCADEAYCPDVIAAELARAGVAVPEDGEQHHDLIRDFNGPRPEIVCLCGSTRFVDEFNRQRIKLTHEGAIVLSIEIVTTQSQDDDPQHVDLELKARLDELHMRKIDLADRVLVLNVDGYVGESTAAEIVYALNIGKPISYLEAGGMKE